MTEPKKIQSLRTQRKIIRDDKNNKTRETCQEMSPLEGQLECMDGR